MKQFSDLCTANNKLCVGCCIRHHQVVRQNVNAQLRLSTKRFKDVDNPALFGNTHIPTSQTNGLCWALIQKRNKAVCAVHPAVHGKDLRPEYPHCYKEYFCPTAKRFESWSGKRKKAFLAFLKPKKEMSWYEYGKGMDEGDWLREFRLRRG